MSAGSMYLFFNTLYRVSVYKNKTIKTKSNTYFILKSDDYNKRAKPQNAITFYCFFFKEQFLNDLKICKHTCN